MLTRGFDMQGPMETASHKLRQALSESRQSGRLIPNTLCNRSPFIRELSGRWAGVG